MSQIVSLPTSVLLELGLLVFLFCCYVVFMVVRFPEGGARLSMFIERLLSLRGKLHGRRAERRSQSRVRSTRKGAGKKEVAHED